MKLLIATRADSKINKITEMTFPLMKEYAKKCGADFKVLDQEPPIWTTEDPPRAHYRIMKFYDLFNEYDRILSMDCDLVVTPKCPSVFYEVPFDKIGTIFEDVGPSANHRRGQIRLAQKQFGDVDWGTGYINTGFAVFSKCHRDIFQPINGDKYFMEFGIDDVHLGYQINKMKFPIHQLPFKWNHMTMFSQDWNGNADRFKSYVIHYAGEGVFDRSEAKNREEQIRKDIEKVRRIHNG